MTSLCNIYNATRLLPACSVSLAISEAYSSHYTSFSLTCSSHSSLIWSISPSSCYFTDSNSVCLSSISLYNCSKSLPYASTSLVFSFRVDLRSALVCSSSVFLVSASSLCDSMVRIFCVSVLTCSFSLSDWTRLSSSTSSVSSYTLSCNVSFSASSSATLLDRSPFSDRSMESSPSISS